MSQETQIEHVEVAPVEKNALEVMEKAAIDIQIATAHQYPRSLSLFSQRAKDMVSVDKETAESCIYRRPVGKDKSGKQTYAEGESIRLAEIVAACYGNLRVGGMITEMTPKYVKAIGIAHDLESNYAAKAEVVESTLKSNGMPYDERMRVVVAKAAQSKAIRDAIFRVVPKSLCKNIVEIAQQIAFGKERTLNERRDAALRWIVKVAVEPERVYAALGISGPEDMGKEQLEILTGIRTALQDNDLTLDEAFPPLVEASNKSGVNGLKERLKQTETKNGQPEPDGGVGSAN